MPETEIRPWKRFASRNVYSNSWISVYEDQIELPTGHRTIYGFMEPKNNFVGIVPFLDARTVLLIRQYRYLQDEVTWEIPSGSIEGEETPEQAAQRELQEEVGYQARQFELVNIMRSNKALMRDKGYIFLAHSLTPAPAESDPTEEFNIVPVSLKKAIEMVKKFEITDCVSIIGLLFAAEQRKLIRHPK